MKSKNVVIVVSGVICMGIFASTAVGAGTEESKASTYPDAYYVRKLEGNYTTFAGSSGNLQSLASGLRNSATITLITTAPTGEISTVMFDPPTKPMGYGNVSRALDFASRDLAAAGITNPTSEQLQAALMGGSVINSQGQLTNMQGVLQLRSDGMGWGQIAHQLEISPAASVNGQHALQGSGIVGAGSASASTGVDVGRVSHGNAYGLQRSGIVTAHGNAVARLQSANGKPDHTNAGRESGKEHSSIVSGAGSAAGSPSNGYALGHGKGIVTAGGASAGYAGITMGNGHGYGGGAYAGAAAAHGIVGAGNGNGNGNGNAFGHAKGKD